MGDPLTADAEAVAATRAILRAAAAGPYSTRHEMPRRVGDKVLSYVLHWSTGESLTGAVAEAVRDGLLPVTAEQRMLVTEHHRSVMVRVLRIERTILAVCAELRRRSIDFRLLKGIALAHAVYADASTRAFVDADVLVAPGTIAGAVAALLELGGERYVPELRPGFDARIGKDVPVLFDGVAVDLHRTIIDGPYGATLPVGQFFASCRPVVLAGIPHPALDIVDAYLHAGLTAGAADVPARLITLRDLLELERSPQFDPDDVVRRARTLGIEAPLARAIRLLGRGLLPDAPPALAEWARTRHQSRRERHMLDCYTSDRSSLRRALGTMAFLGSWRDRLAFARAMTMPQVSYRDAMGWSRLDYLARVGGRITGRPAPHEQL